MSPLAWIAWASIRLYQLTLSPWLPSACRFEPSCSAYGLVAVERHGALRGGWLTVKRIVRCRPGVPGGFDPVPFPDDAQGDDGRSLADTPDDAPPSTG